VPYQAKAEKHYYDGTQQRRQRHVVIQTNSQKTSPYNRKSMNTHSG